jgi:hypothetical protein
MRYYLSLHLAKQADPFSPDNSAIYNYLRLKNKPGIPDDIAELEAVKNISSAFLRRLRVKSIRRNKNPNLISQKQKA